MKKKVRLAQYRVSAEIFNQILIENNNRIIIANIEDYQYGYSNKKKVIYNGKDELICREMYVDVKPKEATYRQIIVKKDDSLDSEDYHKEMMGSTA